VPWIVAQTNPRQEILASAELKKYAYIVYCPLARVTVRHSGKITHRIDPLFSRYLFVADAGQSAAIRRIRHISDVLMAGDRIARVPDAVIDDIRARETNGAVNIDPAPAVRFVPGSAVRVTSGSMDRVRAIYQQHRGSDRAVVLMEVLGARRAVIVDRSNLIPIPV
jgi:transcriptional antiterminator RfaH